MNRMLYASFDDAGQAEKAVGALLDHGACEDDICIVVDDDDYAASPAVAAELEHTGKTGISTTTPEDSGAGAAAGAGIGLGLGVLAGLASIFVPGVGLVIGGGALATAIAAALGATAAGAVAGGVAGYLKDQGIPAELVQGYLGPLQEGGAMLTLVVPSGNINEITGREIVTKYGGIHVHTY